MLLAACKRIRELLPAAVLDPSSHDGVAEEQLRLPQIVEQGERRVDAHEGDFKAVLFEQVRHHVFVKCPLGAPSGFFPVVPMVAAEDERASGAEDRKSTRLNSSHVSISYAVFCL